jgi:DNA gyrase subunit B
MTKYDEEHETYTIDIEYELNGLNMSKSIDWSFLTGPEFAEVNEIHEKLKTYLVSPYHFCIGNKEYVIEMESELVPFLFKKLKSGLYIQRYKGLGEMNPNQLWETTMDKENRTLLKVNINDFYESEEVFDILMGNDSNKRKNFIMENALHVKNLDI